MALETPTSIPARVMEIRAGQPGQPGRAFRQPLVMTAEIELFGGREPNKAKIEIFNLSEDSVGLLERTGSVIQVFAGEPVTGLVFRGDIPRKGVVTELEIPSRKTTISAADSRRIWRDSKLSRSWPTNTNRNVILSDTIKAMGLVIGYLSPRLQDFRFAQGFAFVGRARNLLNQLLSADGARWSIQNGQIFILAAGEVLPGNSPLITPESGLKRSPERTDKGCNFTSVFNPLLRVGGGVEIRSATISGVFKLAKVTHALDSRGTLWETRAEAINPR